MKRFLISIALTMSVAIGVSTQVPDRTGAGDAQKEFDALLERVRKSDESVDFTRLRSSAPRPIHTPSFATKTKTR